MKFSRIILLLIIVATVVQANPKRRHHSHPQHKNHYFGSMYSSRYRSHYSSYRPYRYYRPIVVSTQTSTTTYPTNLVTVTVESIATDIVDLNKLMSRGLITEKDFERAKKTLLNRIGMTINPDAGNTSTSELISQIETLYQMQAGQLITEKEYLKQKKKLLALI